MMPDIKEFMEQKIDVIVPKETFTPHFFALIFDTDKMLIDEKFSHLPGIARVEYLRKEEIAREVKKAMRKLNLR